MMGLREIAQALDGEVAGRQVLAPAPGHSKEDRGLSVKPSSDNADGFVVTCFNNHSWQECRDYVRRRLGIPDWKPSEGGRSSEDIIASMAAARRRAEAVKADDEDRRQRIEFAARLWDGAVSPIGTIGASYLRSRMLELPDDIAGNVVRFHPRGTFGKGTKAPMLVCAMHDVTTGEFLGVHRTALTPEGAKLDRKMLGPTGSSGAIMLRPAASTLVVGEGLETCLSALVLGYGPAVWAMGTAGAIGRLPVLDGVDKLVLLQERDKTSENAVADAGTRWTRAGRAVSVVLPSVGKDLNDSLRGVA